MKFGIVVFPGGSFAEDYVHVINDLLSCKTEYISHNNTEHLRYDCIILPGGYSYADKPRCGSEARLSPVMNEIISFASNGGPVIGIGNGFQILTEAHLLDGRLDANIEGKFICRESYIKVENRSTMFTSSINKDLIRMHTAHYFGRYTGDAGVVDRVENEGRVVLRYSDKDGRITSESCPEGSENNIAAIISKSGNIIGMMPMPERSADGLYGNSDGLDIFKSVLAQVAN
ncbi:MAG: phosphoribosylformylglycinamidine synthase subunit PurQ [Fibrobacteres bacterium]|nr:phosphoribosylformylglycinamidine synthase subunit PurQ [Fibrobacterota bacterium]